MDYLKRKKTKEKQTQFELFELGKVELNNF